MASRTPPILWAGRWTPPETGRFDRSDSLLLMGMGGFGMAVQRIFWVVEDGLAELSADGDALQTLSATVDFEMFRPLLQKAFGRADPSKGGRSKRDVRRLLDQAKNQDLMRIKLDTSKYLAVWVIF